MESQSHSEDSFNGYVTKIANMTMVGHAVGFGSYLGIFDVMAQCTEPKTYIEIAEAGKWKPRYIKEWLNLMVIGKIVDYDKTAMKYHLPKHRHKALTKTGHQNFSVFMEGLSIVTNVKPELTLCFPTDGAKGIPYSSYVGFHQWRNARIIQRYQLPIIQSKFQQVPNLLQQLEHGINVCDAGCSTGHQVALLAEQYAKSNFTGFDIDSDAIKTAEAKAKKQRLNNMHFEVQDACCMPQQWENSFDLFQVWDVVHDVPKPREMLKEIMRVLKPGGMFFMNDINLHTDVGDNSEIAFAPTIYGMSMFHCMPVSLYHEGGEGLGAAWGIEKQKMYLQDAGFCHIKQIEGLGMESYFVAFKP